MRSALVLAAVLASSPAVADDVIISVGADAIETVRSTMPDRAFTFMTDGEKAIVEIDESELDELSDLMHEKHQRCGGFMVHETMDEAQMPAVAERVMEYSLDRG